MLDNLEIVEMNELTSGVEEAFPESSWVTDQGSIGVEQGVNSFTWTYNNTLDRKRKIFNTSTTTGSYYAVKAITGSPVAGEFHFLIWDHTFNRTVSRQSIGVNTSLQESRTIAFKAESSQNGLVIVNTIAAPLILNKIKVEGVRLLELVPGQVISSSNFDNANGWGEYGGSKIEIDHTQKLKVLVPQQHTGIRYDMVTLPGNSYTVSFDIDLGGVTNVDLSLVNTDGVWLWLDGLNITTNGLVTKTFTATSLQTTIVIEKSSAQTANQYLTIDNFKLSNHDLIYYQPDVLSYSDYYPFGSLMPGRNAMGTEYRYGFNGHEKLDEIAGVTGSHLDFGARIYDSRLGKFMSTDPWESKYAWQTSFAYFANSPISKIDWKGFGDHDDKKTSTNPNSGKKHVKTNVKGPSTKIGFLYNSDGSRTKSGNPYGGRSVNMKARVKANDGRQRKMSDVVGVYNDDIPGNNAHQEQKLLDKMNSQGPTDNKMRAQSQKKFDAFKLKYPKLSGGNYKGGLMTVAALSASIHAIAKSDTPTEQAKNEATGWGVGFAFYGAAYALTKSNPISGFITSAFSIESVPLNTTALDNWGYDSMMDRGATQTRTIQPPTNAAQLEMYNNSAFFRATWHGAGD
jgi:RHS repeat-associated protein